jgi:hypothetical protein
MFDPTPLSMSFEFWSTFGLDMTWYDNLGLSGVILSDVQSDSSFDDFRILVNYLAELHQNMTIFVVV